MSNRASSSPEIRQARRRWLATSFAASSSTRTPTAASSLSSTGAQARTALPDPCSYELQIAEGHRGKGLARVLMGCLRSLGQAFGMDKVMLTVFKRECSPFTRVG